MQDPVQTATSVIRSYHFNFLRVNRFDYWFSAFRNIKQHTTAHIDWYVADEMIPYIG